MTYIMSLPLVALLYFVSQSRVALGPDVALAIDPYHGLQ